MQRNSASYTAVSSQRYVLCDPCDLDLFDLIFTDGRGIVMDYPCTEMTILVSAVLVLSCRQTDRQTDRRTHRKMRTIVTNATTRVSNYILIKVDIVNIDSNFIPVHQLKWSTPHIQLPPTGPPGVTRPPFTQIAQSVPIRPLFTCSVDSEYLTEMAPILPPLSLLHLG